MIKSVYIHIPFCKNICSYCDFCKNFYDEKVVDNYLNSLEKEIKNSYKNEIIDTLYIGGGTPSVLSIKELKRLLKILDIFKLSENYEFTFECNYEDIKKELLLLLKKNKVNRISIGLQTFNEKYQSFLERKIKKDEMISKVKLSKSYFNNINVDLMYGFPKETLLDLKNDIVSFLNLNITHISTYCLIIEEHTKLRINKIEEDSDMQSKMYYELVKILKRNGYEHYEISNFSKKGYHSKHNVTYWNNEEYYGFGLGASGFVDGVRYDNTKSMLKYIKGNYVSTKEVVLEKQMIEDEVMLNLRMTKGINKRTFKNKYKMELKDCFDIDQLVYDKFLIEDKKNVYIPEDKLFVSNEIILRILQSCKI